MRFLLGILSFESLEFVSLEFWVLLLFADVRTSCKYDSNKGTQNQWCIGLTEGHTRGITNASELSE